MDLGGAWVAAVSGEETSRALADADFDDSAWSTIQVPGHWSSHADFAGLDGPLVYRRRFETHPPEPGQRAFVTFEGVFYQSDVWLDGQYQGDTEGYFAPHSFEVTEALRARPDHVLAVEVTCSRPSDRKAKKNLTGVFQHWDCIDPEWNPGGIWGNVSLTRTGPVRIASAKVLCREASEERAGLEIEVELDSLVAQGVRVVTVVRRSAAAEGAVSTREPSATNVDERDVAAGLNRLSWRLAVERPDLWWPRALGEQPLYDVEIEVHLNPADPGLSPGPSDRRVIRTGLRRIQVRNFIATVNGERLFLKGANYGPTRRALAEAGTAEIEKDVTLAAEAGLDLLRVHAHIGRSELYAAADRQGVLIWQDLPLQWGYGQVRRQAMAQARQAVTLLGHHPSIAVWCGHNEPIAVDPASGVGGPPRAGARVMAAQLLPSWNKTALDRSIRRALERSDSTREVVAHSGVVPHPAWGTDSHFYLGWYRGEERDFPRALSRLPVLGRFVSEFGAQAVPETAGFMAPDDWPALDWDRLEAHYCLQKEVFDRRVPPSSYPTFQAWKEATQAYQATVVRHHIEALRKLKYHPTGGFCVFMLTDSQPGVTWSLLDHERVPKRAYQALVDACAPVIVTATRPAARYRYGDRMEFDIHAVSDRRVPITGAQVRVSLRWPGGHRSWGFSGDIPADGCVRIGRVSHQLPPVGVPGPVVLEASMEWADGSATNSYDSQVG